MNNSQRKVIAKLNDDNKFLTDAHKSMIEYAKGKTILGVIGVGILVIWALVKLL